MQLGGLFSGPLPRAGLNLLVGATFSLILLSPTSWWTRARLLTAIGIVAAECAAGLIWFHETKLVYFLGVLVFAAIIRLSMSKSPLPALAVLAVTAGVYSRLGRADLISILSFILVAAVMYLNIRSRMQRNEMYELNKRHLAELQEAYEQLQEASAAAMQVAMLEERTRIARAIHDDVGHSLTSLIVQMQALRYMIGNDPQRAQQALEGMLTVAREGLHDIRASVHSLADDRQVSGTAPMKALLSQMEASASIPYTFQDEAAEDNADPAVFGVLFRVLQEAITNIIRHSRASSVEVRLTKERGYLVLRIRDDGAAEPGRPIREGFGLKTMKARLEEKGGRLRYASLPPHGFEITAEIPAGGEKPSADTE